MNKSHLKAYAPQARKDFIAAITARAAVLGITAAHVSAVSVNGAPTRNGQAVPNCIKRLNTLRSNAHP